ncbi:IS66-like element accessory protein TnpA [Bradyrhizobium sp. USDA 4518]
MTLSLALRSSGDAGRGFGRAERRRRWSQDDKARIVEETLAPGAKVTEVARRNGVAASLVITWRRQARTSEQVVPSFTPVQIAAVAASAEETPNLLPTVDGRVRSVAAARTGLIEIDLGNRRCIRVDAHVDLLPGRPDRGVEPGRIEPPARWWGDSQVASFRTLGMVACEGVAERQVDQVLGEEDVLSPSQRWP